MEKKFAHVKTNGKKISQCTLYPTKQRSRSCSNVWYKNDIFKTKSIHNFFSHWNLKSPYSSLISHKTTWKYHTVHFINLLEKFSKIRFVMIPKNSLEINFLHFLFEQFFPQPLQWGYRSHAKSRGYKCARYIFCWLNNNNNVNFVSQHI